MKHISEQIANHLYKEIDSLSATTDNLYITIHNFKATLLDITINYLYNHEDLFDDINKELFDTEQFSKFIIDYYDNLVDNVFWNSTNLDLNIKQVIVEAIKETC